MTTRVDPEDPGSFVVRQVTGAAATKIYLCPGCNQDIPVGQPHIVAWPAQSVAGAVLGGESELRRHWHSGCWRRKGL